MDTLGSFVLDTGAGYLALDASLARRLDLTDSIASEPVGLADRPLARLAFGNWSQDRIQPVMTFDAGVARRVADRPVLGLLGQSLYRDRAVLIDYQGRRLAFMPSAPPGDSLADVELSRAALGDALSERAAAIRFRLLGDGKVVVRAAVDGSEAASLTLIVDTGSSKTALFHGPLAAAAPQSRHWRTIGGVTAPTLLGDASARIARVPRLLVVDARGVSRRSSGQATDGTPAGGSRGVGDAKGRTPGDAAEQRDVDAVVIDGDLERVLSADVGEPVHGLLGYSFLRHYRVTIDYPRRVLWLDPLPRETDDRPYEYCHVGLQLERRESSVVVTGVLDGSPAERAGIRVGDVLVALDDGTVAERDLIETIRSLEGPPGSRVTLTLRRGAVETRYRLTRKRLL
ncbi:MAG: PDZ domain-containing protein [Candidatus Eisenbacteria bacterium]